MTVLMEPTCALASVAYVRAVDEEKSQDKGGNVEGISIYWI